ncbi:hypothetical protein ABFX02_06G193600 [Erythranthe guttata]
MKEVRVENYVSESFIPEEEEEFDRLSFCNYLRLDENNSGDSTQTSRRNSSDHLFEFLISQPGPHAAGSDVIFCGRTIDEEEDEDQLNEYQKRDYFATIRSKSQSQSNRGSSFSDRRISSSTTISGDPTRSRCSSSSSGNLDYHAQRVNITSLTSMSAKSRRRMFMFGPVKFRPEMDLSAIKQRRAASVEKVAAAASGGGRSRWGVLRSSLRGRSHLTSVLARSLGCIPVVAGGGGGGGSWVGVAN